VSAETKSRVSRITVARDPAGIGAGFLSAHEVHVYVIRAKSAAEESMGRFFITLL
jgi:hypothetical protein